MKGQGKHRAKLGDGGRDKGVGVRQWEFYRVQYEGDQQLGGERHEHGTRNTTKANVVQPLLP